MAHPAIGDTVIHHDGSWTRPIAQGRIMGIMETDGRPWALLEFAPAMGSTVPVDGLIRPWPQSMPSTWLFTNEGIDWVGCSGVDSR